MDSGRAPAIRGDGLTKKFKSCNSDLLVFSDMSCEVRRCGWHAQYRTVLTLTVPETLIREEEERAVPSFYSFGRITGPPNDEPKSFCL